MPDWADLLAQQEADAEQKQLDQREANRTRLRPSSVEIMRMEQAIVWPARYLREFPQLLRTVQAVERDEAAAVESDHVETTIACALVERAAHGDGRAVAAGGGEAHPVGMRRRLSGVALGLERACPSPSSRPRGARRPRPQPSDQARDAR